MLGRSLTKCRRASLGCSGRHAAVLFAAKGPLHHRLVRTFVCGQRHKSVTLPHNSCIRDNVDFRSSRRLLGVLKGRNVPFASSNPIQVFFFSSGSNPSEPLEASRYEKKQVLRFLRAFGMTENQGSGMTKEEYEFFKLGRKKNIAKIIKAFKEYDENKGGATELMHCMLIHQRGLQNALEVASVRNMFKVHGRPKSAYIYNILFNAYSKTKGGLDEVERIRSIMDAEGVKATTETYNTLINAYGAYSDNYDKVYELYEEIDTPDVVTYNILLNLHSDKSKHSKSKRIFF